MPGLADSFITPMIAAARQQQQTQLAAQESDYRNKLLHMRQQEMAQESALAPLRQQQLQTSIDATRQGMALDQERITLAREAAAREAAASADKDRIAEETEQAREYLAHGAAAVQSDDPQAWEMVARGFGMPGLEMSPQSLALLGAIVDGSAEGIAKSMQAPEPADEYGRYAQEETAAGRKPLDRIGYAQAKKGKGTSFSVAPDGTVSYSEGGADLTTANRTDAQKVQFALTSVLSGLDRYRDIYAKGGAAVVPGVQKDALLTARRDLQMQMKEMFNLGVINGPDLMLLDQMLVDPTTLQNNAMDVTGVADLDKRMGANIDQVRSQLINMAEPKLKAMGIDASAIGGQASEPGSGSPEGAGAARPAPGTVEDDLLRYGQP